MLGTLLEKVGTLLPKNFIIANLFPMLLFAAINSLMLYWMSGRFRSAVQNYFAMGPGEQALIGFPILIAITLAAYIFSTLNLFQRELLEGQYWPTKMKAALSAGQQRKLDHADDQFLKITKYKVGVERLNGIERLGRARAFGNEQQAQCVYSKSSRAAQAVSVLAKKRLRHKIIKLPQLHNAILLLGQELRSCPVDTLDPDAPDRRNKILLDADHQTLNKCWNYAKTRVENDRVESFNLKEFNYSKYRLAPTAMGNIAESVRGYARSRYSMNLDPFWSRLQKILIDDDKFYSTLVDAKTQLDFMISLFWVTVCFTGFWTIALIRLRLSLRAFFVVAVGGPILSILWYKIALQNYRAFADICRTSVDLYRFKLLDMLHVERPGGNLKERRTWFEINKVIGYGEETVIRYHHPPPPK
jgi:hypothetical protein